MRSDVNKIVAMVPLLIIGFVVAAGNQSRAQQLLCIITVDPKVVFIDAEGGKQEVTVIASAPDCTFAPRTANSWIKTYSSQDENKRTVVIEVSPTANLAQRVGTVMVGTTQIEVVQKARDHISW